MAQKGVGQHNMCKQSKNGFINSNTLKMVGGDTDHGGRYCKVNYLTGSFI